MIITVILFYLTLWVLLSALGIGLGLAWTWYQDRPRPLVVAHPDPPYRYDLRHPQPWLGPEEVDQILEQIRIALEQPRDGRWYSLPEFAFALVLYQRLGEQRGQQLSRSEWERLFPDGERDFLYWLLLDIAPSDGASFIIPSDARVKLSEILGHA